MIQTYFEPNENGFTILVIYSIYREGGASLSIRLVRLDIPAICGEYITVPERLSPKVLLYEIDSGFIVLARGVGIIGVVRPATLNQSRVVYFSGFSWIPNPFSILVLFCGERCADCRPENKQPIFKVTLSGERLQKSKQTGKATEITEVK